jgi:hypothetical protein
MSEPEVPRCPHGRPSTEPKAPTESCPSCLRWKCLHGQYNMNEAGGYVLKCQECIEEQALWKAVSLTPKK